MIRFLSVAVVGVIGLAVSLAGAQAAPVSASETIAEIAMPGGDLPGLPSSPKGKTTIMGGAIRKLDPVRDQFSLEIYGQRPMKILFDERTQIFRDGVKIPLRALRAEDHASVQTVLDGDNVFAVSIHILSQTPDGDCQGHVLSYDPRTGELQIRSSLSPDPVRLYVPANMPIARTGQPAFTSQSSGRNDLVAGTLISASFRPMPGGRDTASRITILATPGSSFQFSGTISQLDLSREILEIVDPRDGKSYEIHFSSAHSATGGDIHLGENVNIKAYYDGARYQAAEIAGQ